MTDANASLGDFTEAVDHTSFIDLDDECEIVDDGEDKDNAMEATEGAAESDDDDGTVAASDEEEGHDGENNIDGIEGDYDMTNVPDREPPRDDCIFFLSSAVDTPVEREAANSSVPKRQGMPLHSIAAHPTIAGIVATAGESEEVYIVTGAAARTVDMGSNGQAQRKLQPAFALQGHTDTITCMAFSPNGDILATGGMDCKVRLWSIKAVGDGKEGQETRIDACLLHELSDLSGEVECLLWHPSGLAVIAGGADAQTIMWNANKGTVAMYYSGHRANVSCIAWAADVKKIVSSSADGSIMLFSAKTAEVEMNLQKDLSPDQAGVTAIQVVTPTTTGGTTGEVCIVGCEDGSCHIVSLVNKKVVKHLETIHEQGIEKIAMCGVSNATCQYFATCSCDCSVAVWDMGSYTIRSVVNTKEAVIDIIWRGSYLLCAGGDGIIRMYDGRSDLKEQGTVHGATIDMGDDDVVQLMAPKVLMGHKRFISAIALGSAVNGTHDVSYSNEDVMIYTASDDGTMRAFVAPKGIALFDK
eukprot:Tbor_TRINITY_DN5312_c0_g4::TRINITY_DN5312_c0_g4_i2::g.3898::m.3898